MAQKVHLLIGLPASGKTTFTKKLNSTKIRVLNLDGDNNQESRISYFISDNAKSDLDLFIDGPIFDIYDLYRVIGAIPSGFAIVLHYWNENREQCLENDRYRVNVSKERVLRSEITIKYGKYISLDEIHKYIANNIAQKDHEISIIEHEVYQMSEKDKIINKYVSYSKEGNPQIVSEEWSNGGTYVNYEGNTFYILADTPKEFDELDNLLEELCPTLTFFQYKKLIKECTSIETWEERDYYGGSENKSHHVCDVKKLKSFLDNINY